MKKEHRYLIVDADYRTSGLRDEFEGMLMSEDIALSRSLWADLARWVGRYQPFALVSEEELAKSEVQRKIEGLDKEGMEIAIRIQRELGDYYKVRYYSAARNEFYPETGMTQAENPGESQK